MESGARARVPTVGRKSVEWRRSGLVRRSSASPVALESEWKVSWIERLTSARVGCIFMSIQSELFSEGV
jgi:hypothetical protein